MRSTIYCLLLGFFTVASAEKTASAQENKPNETKNSNLPAADHKANADNPERQDKSSDPDRLQDLGDPTVPSEAILRRMPQKSVPTAEDLLESAKRLQSAGLTLKARERIDQLEQLENAPLDIKDEAAVWWASVAPKDLAALENKNTATIGPPSRTGNTTQAARVNADLPDIPEIVMKGIVLSSPERGTAMLVVGARRFSIQLKPREKQDRIPIPQSQFVDVQSILERRDRMMSGDKETKTEIEYEISLQCSFVNDGVVYNLEAFNNETLVLRALPHNELILVRSDNAP